MNAQDPQHEDLRCIDVVEMLTAYLDGALDEGTATAFEHHLAGCTGCSTALTQWRTTIRLTSRLSEAEFTAIDPLVRHRFIAAVHELRRR